MLMRVFLSFLACTLQKMQLVPVPAKAFGAFFEGDCYIVLYVSALRLVHIDLTVFTSSQVHGRFLMVFLS